jgi:Zn-finger nucleic acid-binding protein
MALPNCPRCRQKMSSTEYGRYGAFICFYCDSTWLPATAIAAALAHRSEELPLGRMVQVPASQTSIRSGLTCPECAGVTFARFTKNGVDYDLCAGCAGMHFPKGAFEMAFPKATKDDFPLDSIGGALAAESIVWAAVIFLGGIC